MDVDELMLETEDRMDKSVQHLMEQYSKVRTGKASTAMFDGLVVKLYGSEMPLKQVANILTPEARLVIIQPYDKNAIPNIEKTILTSDLGVNPVNDGTVIRINIPQLTEERRKDMSKMVNKMAEEARQSVRAVRRDANEQLKKAQKDGEIPEDNMYKLLDDIQKLTDDHVADIDKRLESKTEEIMEV